MFLKIHQVPGNDVLQMLLDYRSHFSKNKLYPFLIGDANERNRTLETATSNREDTSKIIQLASNLSTAEWVAERKADINCDNDHTSSILGEWPTTTFNEGSIALHKDVLSGVVFKEVYIGLATIDQPWHLPAVLNNGGWNECPSAEVQCAYFRDWQERFGAEITGVSTDVIECIVTKPPKDRPSAIELAWEQYWFCNDIVDQGCETISNLAATLLNSNYWYFWWD